MSIKAEYLFGDLQENFYQLGRKEQEDFVQLEEHLKKLLSSYHLLKIWQDLLSKSQVLFKKKSQTFFEIALKSYAEGLERPVSEVRRVFELVEIAAHYGQINPELKAIIPGCTSVFEKSSHGVYHHRLIDFPLMNFFKGKARIYHSQFTNTVGVSWVGLAGMSLAPLHLFSQTGFSLALHQKPSPKFYSQGELIYSVLFDLIFRNETLNDIRKDLRIKTSQNKWGGYIIDKNHDVLAFDIEGPQHWFEKFELTDSRPLIFTNVPVKYSMGESVQEDHFVTVAEARARGLSQILKKKKNFHLEDLYQIFHPRTDQGHWSIPALTTSTQIGFSFEITKASLETLEEKTECIWKKSQVKLKEPKLKENPLSVSWEHLSEGQAYLDQGKEDIAYHHFQMARSLCPQGSYQAIIEFFIIVLEYKFSQTSEELGFIYNRLLEIEHLLPPHLQDHAILMRLRFERRLKLVVTSNPLDLKHPGWQKLWTKEKDASDIWLSTWKSLITPRFDLLDVFYPYQ